MGIGNGCFVREHGQVPDAGINPYDAVMTVVFGDRPLDLDGEGDEPAVGGSGDGCGHDAGSAELQASGELASRFRGS